MANTLDKDMIGKTIKNIVPKNGYDIQTDDINLIAETWIITFTDGTSIEIYANIYSGVVITKHR